MSHLTEDLLKRFLSLSTDAEENRRIIVHMLSGCPRCAAAARQLVFPPAPSEADNSADLMAPGDLAEEARDHISSALSAMDQLLASLAGNEPLLQPEGPLGNVVPFLGRSTCRTPDDVGPRSPRNAS